MGRLTKIVLLLCLAVPAWGQSDPWITYGDGSAGWQGDITSPEACSDPNVWCGPTPIAQFEPGIPRAEVRDLALAYQEAIKHLEAQLREHDSIIRSLQAQLAANRDYQKALEENNEVLRELVGGKKKSKLGWVWFGVKTGGALFTACEATGIC